MPTPGEVSEGLKATLYPGFGRLQAAWPSIRWAENGQGDENCRIGREIAVLVSVFLKRVCYRAAALASVVFFFSISSALRYNSRSKSLSGQ